MSDGLKSSWELAMERLEKKEGKLKALSEEQKSRISQIEQKAKARIAETEIMFDKKKNTAKGEPEALREIARQRKSEIDKIQDRAERDKNSIRSE